MKNKNVMAIDTLMVKMVEAIGNTLPRHISVEFDNKFYVDISYKDIIARRMSFLGFINEYYNGDIEYLLFRGKDKPDKRLKEEW